MRSRLTPALIVSLLLVGSLGAAPVPAQVDLADARAEREETRRRAAEVAAEIDLLEAEDEAVANALVDLDAFIAQTDEDIDAAERAIRQAEIESNEAAAEIARLGREIGAARDVVRQLAVHAYVGPSDPDLDILLSAQDPVEGDLRRFFVGLVGGTTDDAVAELRRLQDDQARARNEADAARGRADAALVELQAKRAELVSAVTARKEVQAEIDQRITQWEGESVALAEADAEITALIKAEESRAEAARLAEQRRQAELERQRREAEEQRQLALQNQLDDETEEPTATDDSPTPTSAEPTPRPGAPASLVWPINGVVTSQFGYRVHPIFGTERFHSGLDIDGDSGQPIVAAAEGVVIASSSMGGYGNAVIIDHGGGLTTLYAHQSRTAVTSGQLVRQGDVVGYVGSTGWSTGPHLHFETRSDGSPTDPLAYL